MIEGKSGVQIRPEFADTELPVKLFAPVTDFDGRKYVKPRKAIKVMCVPIQFGYVAAQLALEDATLERERLDPDRVATVFGTETFFADPLEVADVFRKCTVDKEYQHERWGEFAMREIQPLWMLKYLPNMVASHISIAVDARGPSNSICQAEASGLLSIIEGADLIRRGVADVVVAGGTGSRLALSSMLYRGFSILSGRIDEPSKACRPFELNRDGMVVGEGAGAVVLESAEFAAARGKPPLAKLAGWARSFCDPTSNQMPQKIGRNLQSALDQTGLTPNQIGHYHAHATGQVASDQVEATAVANLLDGVPVFAGKANFGHLGPGSAAVELVAAILAKQHAKLPPNINFETPDPNCKINISRQATELSAAPAIKFTSSATGQLVSIVIE